MTPPRVSEALEKYPAFFYIRWLKSQERREYFLALNTLIAVIFGLLMFGAATLDGALYVDGPTVGFLEHPAIFAFIATQCIVPYAVARGVALFVTIPEWGNKVLRPEFLNAHQLEAQEWFTESVQRGNNKSRVIFSLLAGIGIVAFAWNSISNQDPLRFVGFDFWDSANHVWGYATTRVYKFYMWCLFFPSLLHIEIMMLMATRRVVVSAAREGGLILEPFHPDKCGGVRAFIDTVIIPLLPALAISSLLALSAAAIHKRFDLTTGGALILLCSTFSALYFVIAASLRRAIITEKERQLGLIAKIQHDYFFSLIARENAAIPPEEVGKSISSLSGLADTVRSIPNWPQLRVVIRAVSLAGSPPALGWLAGLILPKLLAKFGL